MGIPPEFSDNNSNLSAKSSVAQLAQLGRGSSDEATCSTNAGPPLNELGQFVDIAEIDVSDAGARLLVSSENVPSTIPRKPMSMVPLSLAVIPARYASTRFPGKPLALIDGKPMIQWVYEASVSCEVFDLVKVATDDQRIAGVVQEFGGQVELTSANHETGTDRVAEVARRYPEASVVVNVQGDQPFVTPEILERLLAPYTEPTATGEVPNMATVACPLAADRHFDPHSVKVVCDQAMNAIYFSRAPIPYCRDRSDTFDADAPVYHHLGLYAFRAEFLRTFCTLTPTPLERCEGLEQLRAIEHGHQIRVSLVDRMIHEVNVPDDLVQANAMMAHQE